MAAHENTEEQKAHSQNLRELRNLQNSIIDAIPKASVDVINRAMIEGLSKTVTNYQVLRKSMIDDSTAVRAFEMPDIDQAFAIRVEQILLPKIADSIHECVPFPGEWKILGDNGSTDGSLLLLVDLFKKIRRDARYICGVKVGEDEQKKLAGRLARMATFYHKFVKKQISDYESPDITKISYDQFRLDILKWVLEDLGEETALKTVKTQSIVTARLAIGSAEEVVKRYLERQDLDSQFDFSIVLASVDDLVTLIRRIIEADVRDRADEPMFMRTIGAELVANFVNNLGMTILAVFNEAERKLDTGKLTQKYFESCLEKAKRIYAFCNFVDEQYGEKVFSAVQNAIATKSKRFFEKLETLDQNSSSVKGQKAALNDFLMSLVGE